MKKQMGICHAVMLACTSALVTGALLASPHAAFADEPTTAPVAIVASNAPAAAVAPQNVTWTKTAASTARLSWTASTEADGSAPHYRVEVKFDSGDPYSISDTAETSASITISPGASATATVTDIAQNTSASSEQYTQPALAPDAPKSANVTSRDMNYASKPPAVRAVWVGPDSDNGSEIKQYRVQLFAGKGKSKQLVDSSTVNADTFSHTFSNLEFETFYAVEVSAINGAGNSKVAKSNQVETVAEPEASPEPTVTVSTPSETPSPSASTPSASATPSQVPVAPSPTPSAQATDSQLLFVAFLPIIILLLIAASVALFFVVRHNRRVDAYNRAREVRDDDQDL